MPELISFQDNPNTAVTGGKKREWIYPKLIKGKLYQYRKITSYLLLGLLFSGPFLKINNEQLVLLNFPDRKFAFFGVMFMPQDFYLFVFAMLAFMVFIILFTAIFGRLWCGWACPQTIFMEMVFRRIEYWIEGDAQHQKKLDAAPFTSEKLLKKGAKHLVFILLSFIIANIFLAYIIGSDALLKIIREPVSMHVYGFFAIWIFTLIFYLVFARVRELVCTMICPYGRLQGVLLDRRTLVVAYDHVRGEPRGHLNRSAFEIRGDCIDCNLCVQVCPTGIDIRQGTQIECINCTACIDACDMVMEKINRPARLIGFKSEEQIKGNTAHIFSKRIYGYAVILLVLFSTLSFLSIRRSDIAATVLRASGTVYQLRNDSTVSNLYNADLVNKTGNNIPFHIVSSEPLAKIQYISKGSILMKGESARLTFFIILPNSIVKKYKSEITLNIISNGEIVNRVKTNFIAPPNLQP